MTIQIDPVFQQAKAQAQSRRKRRRWSRLAALVAALAMIGGGALWWFNRAGQDISDLTMVSGEGVAPGTAPAQDAAGNRAFLNLRRAPMILRLEEHGQGRKKTVLPGPATFLPDRAGPQGPQRLAVLRDGLYSAGQQVTVHLPSDRDDFALFQAHRQRGLADGTHAANPVATQQATSAALVQPANDRRPLFRETVLLLATARPLASLLERNGFAPEDAHRIDAAARRLTGLGETLPRGSVVALRWRPGLAEQTGRQLLQMSVYRPEQYLASIAQTGPGRFQSAADPWAGQDLLQHTGRLQQQPGAGQHPRLLDALYSTALRNGLPTDLAGELIVMLSRRFDLERPATESDRLTLLYSNAPGPQGQGAGQILFAGIESPGGQIRCYVTANSGSESGFGCFDFAAGAAAVRPALGAGLMIPVTGVKTSGFGQRMHPVVKEMRPHNGIDWAAPKGTPVYAARAGRVKLAQDSGSYGNLVALSHSGGAETRYAHLEGFADGLVPGHEVSAGELIGYVGSTGRSTGPHLHFELWMDGRPVDPAQFGGAAVAALVDQIVKVESAGQADAKNPLSTATGLGQFIEGTWLRMMRSYRPELAENLTRAELLELRLDPGLSREMVHNLARENEAFLRDRGHQITPGRLYLAHFLGAAGAHQALASTPSKRVDEVMGAAVVSANPFLKGKQIADLLAWADRKMRGRGRTIAVPAEVQAYKTQVDAVLSGL